MMARTKRSRRSYSEYIVTQYHYWVYRTHAPCAYLIPYPFGNGNPIDSTGGLWTRGGFRPVAGRGRPWTESNPRWRGGLARPGDRGDRRARCRSARESWPAGLPDAPRGEGRRFGVGCGSGGGGETRPLRGTAPGSPGPAHPTGPPSGLLGGGEGRCFQPGGGPERGQG